MPPLERELNRASRSRLLQVGRDALRRAGSDDSPVLRVPDPAEVNQALGLLSQTLDALDTALTAVQDEIAAGVRSGSLDATDGPFAGDPEEAARTTELWLSRARAQGLAARESIGNAHVAAGGLTARR